MHVMKMDGSGMMTKEVGTLREIGAQVGDVYTHDEYSDDKYEITMIMDGKAYTNPGSYDDIDFGRCRIISRAANQPKLWRDMTTEEKGALLLAEYDGKVIEWSYSLPWVTARSTAEGYTVVWDDSCAYRVNPEPKVETVELYGDVGHKMTTGMWCNEFQDGDKYRITFKTIDGKPYCASIKMEEL